MPSRAVNDSLSIWQVYMLRCADDSIYTGMTNDLERRIAEHDSSKRGARYTRGRRPVSLIYHEVCESRSEALKREAEIKKLPRVEKLHLAESLRLDVDRNTKKKRDQPGTA